MKKKGSKSDFIEQRDRELYAHFREVLRTARDVSLRDMLAMAASRPVSRFWVSEPRAAVVVGALLRGETGVLDTMYPKRREMYEEIFRRVCAMMEADPGLCMTHAVDAVVCSPAPESYLTAEGAKAIVNRMRRRLRALNAIRLKFNPSGPKS